MKRTSNSKNIDSMGLTFTKAAKLPYSRRWTITKLKDCQLFAVKIDGWFAYREHIKRVRKKTHKATSCR